MRVDGLPEAHIECSMCILTHFILDTGKQVLWQTVKTQTVKTTYKVTFHQSLHCLLR